MNKAHALLRWWLVQSTTFLAALYCYYLGLFDMLWTMDISKISFIIIALYLLVSGLIGTMTRRATNDYETHRKFIETYVPVCEKLASKMQDLGLIGTVIGFMVLLGPTFAGFNVSNAAETQKIIAVMAIGMSTALTTTLVGLVGAVLTRLQLLNLDTITDAKEEETDE